MLQALLSRESGSGAFCQMRSGVFTWVGVPFASNGPVPRLGKSTEDELMLGLEAGSLLSEAGSLYFAPDPTCEVYVVRAAASEAWAP